MKAAYVLYYQVYNMKSTKKLDPFDPAPYDFFDLMTDEAARCSIEAEKVTNIPQDSAMRVHLKEYIAELTDEKAKEEQVEHYEAYITQERRKFERTISPRVRQIGLANCQ